MDDIHEKRIQFSLFVKDFESPGNLNCSNFGFFFVFLPKFHFKTKTLEVVFEEKKQKITSFDVQNIWSVTVLETVKIATFAVS